MSIRDYVRSPPAFVHCAEPMQRYIEVAPGMALHNAIASERHYDGLRAQDGTAIDTRAKHRQYMKDRNLTTIDDYASTWKKAAEQRAQRMEGADTSRALDVADAITRLGG